ncbi:hypothetical protein [Sphingobacterium sp. LRF_L2]|uniref:hypothetical protein n=1 Tax=Sphingobacterium sp. LRF_L2 TaxID=3369421 RepID=UPI003F5DE078
MKLFFLVCMFLCLSSQIWAQKKQKFQMLSNQSITVDADLQDWPSLVTVDSAAGWSYQLAQDPLNIYIAMHIVDPQLQHIAAWNGLLFEIPNDQKNKSSMQFIFPFPDGETKRAVKSSDFETKVSYLQELIRGARGYYVSGFLTVPDGILSVNNDYGLKSSVNLDDSGLRYEAVIPKNVVKATNNLLTLKIGINDSLLASNKHTQRSKNIQAARKARGHHRQSSKKAGRPPLSVLLETTID